MAEVDTERNLFLSLLGSRPLRNYTVEELGVVGHLKEGRVVLVNPRTGRRFELTVRALGADPGPDGESDGRREPA
jgi:hypothetical protein